MKSESEAYNKINNLFNNSYKYYVGMICDRVRSLDDAEDIVMDAFSEALGSAHNWDEEKGSVAAWFFTILYRSYYKWLRKNQQSLSEDGDVDDEVGFEIESVILNDELIDRMTEEISSFPLSQQDILYLRFVAGVKKSKDIADMLDTTVTNVTSVVHVFRKAMKEKLLDE